MSFGFAAVALALFVLMPASAHAQASFVYSTVDPPNASAGGNPSSVSFATGTSASGMIVGFNSDSGTDHGYLLKKGVYSTVDAPGAVNGTDPSGVNSAGDIVGTYYDSDYNQIGFVKHNGVFSSIVVPDATGTSFNNVNETGLAALVYYDADGNANNAIYNVNTAALTYLPDVPGGFATANLETVGEDGSLLYNVSDNSGAFHGLLDQNGKTTMLDFPLAGVQNTYANSMNSAGDITGNFEDASGASHGFFYDLPDNMWSAIDEPGATNTFLLLGNSSTQWVGAYGNADGTYHSLSIKQFTGSVSAPEPSTLSLVLWLGPIARLTFLRRKRGVCLN